MSIKECYEKLNGDYNDVMGRLRSEALVRRFVLKFLSDQSAKLLFESMESGNCEEAFRAAHTLKGVCQNLSFTALYVSSRDVTEALRGGDYALAAELLPKLKADFERTASAIEEFAAESN